MTKDSYVRAFETSELLANDLQNAFAVFSSSGSSGSAHYWPQLRSQSRYAPLALRYLLQMNFSIHKKKTMAIVAGALGSWIGGDYLSWILKSIAVKARYAFCVFAPGKQPDEIVEAITSNTLGVEQFILFLCPSDIPHLCFRAEALGKVIPSSRLRYVVTGEPIPEPVRMSLQEKAGVPQAEPFMISIYGSTDTGVLGAESAGSVALRKLLTLNDSLAEHIGLSSPIPHLFHSFAPNVYMETIERELCVTRWQGIPIVRYNVRDRVSLYRWRAVRRAILESKLISPEQEPYREAVRATNRFFGDLIALHGRTDRCIIIGGSNLTEPILDDAVRSGSLQDFLTGQYRAQVVYRGNRQLLELQLEHKPGVVIDSAITQFVYCALIERLGQLQPEFKRDWETVYQYSDGSPARRVLQIEWREWPSLSVPSANVSKQASVQVLSRTE